MNNEKWKTNLSRLKIIFEPDISLSSEEKVDFNRCLNELEKICDVRLVLHCELCSISSLNFVDRDSMRLNHYLRVRQVKKFYWMRNIKEMFLSLRSPTNVDESNLKGNLIEFHSCQRIPLSARTLIEQEKPIRLIYFVEERSLKLNLRGENCLLQLIFSVDRRNSNGIYYKWSDEGQIRSTTIQFDVNYSFAEEFS